MINLKRWLDWPISFKLKYVKNVHLFKSFSINISIHVWRCTQFVQQIYFDTNDSALSTLIWITGNKVVTFSWNMSKSENICRISTDGKQQSFWPRPDPCSFVMHIITMYNTDKYSLLRKYSTKKTFCLVPDILIMMFVIVNSLTLISSALDFYMKLNISHSMI